MVSHNLRSQRRYAAAVLKCGKRRVYMDPRRIDDISVAMSKQAIRRLKEEGAIQKREIAQTSRTKFKKRLEKKRLRRRCGPGRMRGKLGARVDPKRMWMLRIRSLRRVLKKFRNEGKIDCHMHQKLYKRCKGNMYKNKRGLIEAIFHEQADDEAKKNLSLQQEARKVRSTRLLAKKLETRQKKLMAASN